MSGEIKEREVLKGILESTTGGIPNGTFLIISEETPERIQKGFLNNTEQIAEKFSKGTPEVILK